MKKTLLLFGLLINIYSGYGQEKSNGLIIKLKPFYFEQGPYKHVALGIEKPFSYKASLELKGGYLWDKSPTHSTELCYLHFGPRFYFNFKKEKKADVFKSNFFFQPEVIFWSLEDNVTFQGQELNFTGNRKGAMVNLGRKESFRDIFSLELAAGIGIVVDTTYIYSLDFLVGIYLGRGKVRRNKKKE